MTFEDLLYSHDDPSWRARVGQTARMMVERGITADLDVILREFPEIFNAWIESSVDVQALIQEFGGSDRWLSWALARTHNLSFDNIYRALKHSPIRPYMGDITLPPRHEVFYEPEPVLRVVEPRGVNLSEIRKGYYIEQGLHEFSQNAIQYLANLEAKIAAEPNEQQKQVLGEVYGFYQEVLNLEFPGLHSQLLDQFGQPRRDKSGAVVFFPSSHQRMAIVKAAQEGSFAVFDDTGSGKTGIGIGSVEYVDAERALVICPAGVKDTWEAKIKEYYIENPGVVRIEGSKPISSNGEKYTLISYNTLVSQEDAILSLAGEFDYLVVDEGQYINNPNQRSDALIELAKRIERKLILTATPVRNSADDIARIAHILSPHEFPTADSFRKMGESGMPSLVELLATKTIRRKTEDLVELPLFCPESGGEIEFHRVEFGSTQRAIYDTIFDDPSLSSFTKIRLLRLSALDHNLVRGKYQISFEEEAATQELQRAYRSWLKLKNRGIDIAFDSNFLVTRGYKHLFVGAHLYYPRGFDEFVQMHASDQAKQDWTGVAEPTKFVEIRDIVEEKLAHGEKIVVFSGHFTKGVLREVFDVRGEAIMEDLYSYLCREFPGIEIGRIDGKVSTKSRPTSVSEREAVRLAWQSNLNCRILLTNIPSASLGIDCTVNDGVTTGVSIIGIDLPYTHADFWQMISRVYRFGQTTPVNVCVLEAVESIDEGVHDLILAKEEIAQWLLDGLTLNEVERQILERSKEKSYLLNYTTSPRRELERRLYSMRGKGVVANNTYLETILKGGKTVGEAIADLYSRYWEYTYSGHTARVVEETIKGLVLQDPSLKWVVDAGSGPLVLDRIMRQSRDMEERLNVISIDINRHMLASGIEEMAKLGFVVDQDLIINRPMSDTGIASLSCDAVVCSLAFHFSNCAEDRGGVLAEANRVLKLGGYYLLTLPEKYLNPDQYRNFCKALEKFGFKINSDLSGKVEALDYKDVPFLVWLILARKTGEPTTCDLPMDEFQFSFETPKISSFEKGNDKKRETRGRIGPERDRLVKHQSFTVLDPDDDFKPKGSPMEILLRFGLELDEDTIRRRGWVVEKREKKDRIIYSIRK